MTAKQVSLSALRRLVPQDQQDKLNQALSRPGTGLAIYISGNSQKLLVSWGTRDADLPGYPSSSFGADFQLSAYCQPKNNESSGRSPLLHWEQPQQITSPPRSQSRTDYPGFGGGSVSAVRMSEPEPQPTRRELRQERPPIERAPVDESGSWWDRLGKRGPS